MQPDFGGIDMGVDLRHHRIALRVKKEEGEEEEGTLPNGGMPESIM
jgi:hypothetical protein